MAMATPTTTLFLIGFTALLAVRLLAAARAPIMDCDETFNYWEPLHYVLNGKGFQTWEYSPQFALRSYVYIELHAVVLRMLRVLPGSLASGTSAFFALRQCLAVVCATSEALFCRAVAGAFGTRAAALLLIFLGASSGMFHSGVALLPSTTCMYGVLLGYAAWLSNRPRTGLLCGTFVVVLVWPIVAPMFIPMGVHALLTIGPAAVAGCAVFGLLAFGLVPALIDGYLYYGAGHPVWAVGNFLAYNAFGRGGGGQGANLYGEEPWSFYPRNLLLNFNVLALLGLGSLFAILALPGARARKMHATLMLSGM
jgi:alpha-1,2-mannosyltransferase